MTNEAIFVICFICGALAYYFLERATLLAIKEYKIYKRFKSIKNVKSRRNSR